MPRRSATGSLPLAAGSLVGQQDDPVLAEPGYDTVGIIDDLQASQVAFDQRCEL